MRYGDRVEILRTKYKDLKDLAGLTGYIYTADPDRFYTSIAVKIDNHSNPNSRYGVYYFKKSEIKLLEGETDMKDIMDGNYRVAIVSFIDKGTMCDKNYACYDDSIKVGDICVVKPANHPFTLAKIEALYAKDAFADLKVTREIVCRANFEAYNKRVEGRKRRAKLMHDMKDRAAKLQEIALFEMLSKTDPEMLELLNEYKEVSGYECQDL